MDKKYPVNVWYSDGDWSCEGHATCASTAVGEFLRCHHYGGGEDLRAHILTAGLVDRDLLDGKKALQSLSEERLRELFCGEMDELGGRLIRAGSRWQLIVEYWEVQVKEV